MKIFKAFGRMITNPLCAVVICSGGGFALWFYLGPGKITNPGIGNAPATRAARPGRDRATRTTTVDDRKKQGTPDQIAAVSRTRPKQGQPHHLVVDGVAHFEAENEAPETEAETTAKRLDRVSSAISALSPTASSVDVIGPEDPRATALSEYPAKKAASPDTIRAHKEVALWCDQHGLWDEAKNHWEAVVRLEPQNDESRKRLGFRLRDRAWVSDPARAEDMAVVKANGFWGKELEKQHMRMKCRSKLPGPGRADATARIEAVGDPRAASSFWKVFAADASHHGLMVGVLSRYKTTEASRMRAALAVYSQDQKAQAAAITALRGREAAEYGEKLVNLMHRPMRIEERTVPGPGTTPARSLFVEGETRNYEFLFSRAEALTPESIQGCFQPRLSASEIEMARRFNENEAALARQGLDQQVSMARAMIEKFNDSIKALNKRVAHVLNEASSARIRPEPEDGRRWLASILKTAYTPEAERPKSTITEIVSPLYSPTFLPIPVAT
jgi:hypothetical protein